MQQVLISYLFYTKQYIYIYIYFSPNLPIHPTPSDPPLVSICFFSTSVSVSTLQTSSICTKRKGLFKNYVSSIWRMGDILQLCRDRTYSLRGKLQLDLCPQDLHVTQGEAKPVCPACWMSWFIALLCPLSLPPIGPSPSAHRAVLPSLSAFSGRAHSPPGQQ